MSTLAILVDGATYLLPVGRFAGMAWLIWAGFALPATRANKTGTNPQARPHA
jgi:hypothetical protein